MRQIIDGIEMLAAADATGDLARDAARSAEMVQEAMMTLGAWFPELVRELPRSIQRTGAVGQQFEDVWDPPSERAERLDGVDAWFTATDTGNAARAIVDLYDESLELIEQLYLGNFLKDEQGPQVTGAERSRLRRSLMRVHELTGLLEVEGG